MVMAQKMEPGRTRNGERIVDAQGRNRYRGRARRGRLTNDADDAQDTRLAVKELQAAHELLVRADSATYDIVERAANRAEAHAKIGLASRLVDDVLLRRGKL